MTLNEAVRALQGELMQLPEDEFRDGLRAAFDSLKAVQDARARLATSDFKVGDRVRFAGRGGAALTGTVEAVNRKTLTVSTDGALPQRWRVDANVVERVGKEGGRK